MRLLFIYDMPPEHALHLRDGLWAALKELKKEWEVKELNLAVDKLEWVLPWVEPYDFILGWGGNTSQVASNIATLSDKKGLCFGGGDIDDPILDKFDVVFVENKVDLIKPNFKHAFGTNRALFVPRPAPKIIDALYPAAFANWKHQEIFAEICQKEKLKGLAVGYIQQNNLEESQALVKECIDQGVAVMDWIPARALAGLYNMSKEVIITADEFGGSQRTVLEAKASGVPVRIVSESPKLLELQDLTSKEVFEKWNQYTYAEALKKGIEECVL
jgi:glycosyltransferase involved in cell wall biosynthesis